MRSWSCSQVSGLHSSAGTHQSLSPVNELGVGRDGATRAESGAAALGDKSVGVGTGSGENGVGEAPDIREGRVTQKTMEKIGDRHLPREEVGTDELGQNVECEGGAFRRAGAIEVDDPKKAFDNDEKEGVLPDRREP
jgi:hypothetical protein